MTLVRRHVALLLCLLASLPCSTCADEPRILAYGDSLSAGFYARGRKFAPYAPPLSELLGGCTVDWIGLSGWTTGQMLNTLPGAAASGLRRRSNWQTLDEALNAAHYTHVAILGGTNDLGMALGGAKADENSSEAARSLAQPILDNLRKLHEAAHAAGAKSIAITVPEVAYEQEAPMAREVRAEINRGLARMVQRKAGQMALADAAVLLPRFNVSVDVVDKRWDDGLHFTPHGYEELAGVVVLAGPTSFAPIIRKAVEMA